MIDIDKLFAKDGSTNKRLLNSLSDSERDEIIAATSFLQGNPKLSWRLKAIKLGITEHKKCVCGKYQKYSPIKGIMFSNYCSISCAKNNIKNNAGEKQKITKRNKKEKYFQNVESGEILPKEIVTEFLLENLDKFKNGGSQGTSVLYENPSITKTIIHYTKDHDKFNARIYEFLYGMPGCEICGTETYFLSLEKGFCRYCEKHAKEIASVSKGVNSVNKALEKLNTFENFNEYEILSIPTKINDAFQLKHIPCQHVFDLNLKNGRTERYILKCPCCENPTVSKPEIEIHNILKSHNISFIPQYRINNKRIDIVIPEFNLAIEYHGMMDHSYGVSKYTRYNTVSSETPNFHLDRFDICKDINLKLFQIFEYEWLNIIKHKIWLSIISKSINVTNIISGDECEKKIISKDIAKNFMNNNHLEGYFNSNIHLGLYYSDTLVACLISNENIRYCEHMEYVVTNGFEILSQNVTGIILDNKRFLSYNLSGEDVPPKPFKFAKNKMKITECDIIENLYQVEYRRFWDAGYIKFVI
jgi:hypothetical protein